MPYKKVEKQREASRKGMKHLRQKRKSKLDKFHLIWCSLESGQPFYFPVVKEKTKIKEFGVVPFEDLPNFFNSRNTIGACTPSEVWMCRRVFSEHRK